MGFRINRGIFQYKDGENFRNKFKIAEDGSMVEVDVDGNPITAFMKVGDKATDADKLDGVNSSQFLRSDADDTVSGHTEWQDGKQIRLGNGADLRMWHDGSHHVFRSYRHGANYYFQAEDNNGSNHAMLYMFANNTRPYVSLYEDGGERLRTNSTGIAVSGTARVSGGITSTNSGGYGIIRGYDNDNHFIVIRGAVTTGQSTLEITGAHKTTFVEHADDSNEGWYFVSKASGNYTEKARIDGLGNIYSSNIITNQANIQSITSDGTIANDKGSYLHLGGWAVGRTHASAVLVNTAYRADYAESLFNENISRFANDANYLTQDALTDLEEGLRAEINGVETVANSKQDAGNYATFANNIYLGNSATTANFITELTNLGAFQDNYKAFKVAWSYAGNSNLDVGFESVELAGCLVECWGGTYKHVRLTRPTTGTGGRSIYVYNDQGSGYAPGWRQIWTSDEFSSTSVSNWNTAYGWGNHASAGYLTTTGKAADSDKLDGYDWGQSGKNVRATEFYADNWFRNYNSGEGLFNQATGQHWYSDHDDYWNIAGGTGANGLRFRDEHAGTIRGYVYANSSNQVGFLDAGGSWAIRHTNDSATEFYDADERVFSIGQGGHGSNYGTVSTHGNGRGGWEGYSINERFVWMSSDATLCGMYNDMDNEWMTQYHRNGAVRLYHNGGFKFETTSSGVSVSGNVVASGSVTASSFSGNGSGLTNVPASIPFTTVIGEATACVSMNFDGRAMVFIMADGTSYSIDGAKPNG